MLAECEQAKKEKKAETGELSKEKNSELEKNKTFVHNALSSKSSLSGDSLEKEKSSSDEEEENWEDNLDGLPARRLSYLDTGNTSYAKKKLVKILAREVSILKQQWSFYKILTTLLYHQKDKRLCSAFWQFKAFHYQTLMTELEDTDGQWSSSLIKKNCNLMIKLCFRKEMKKRYGHKI